MNKFFLMTIIFLSVFTITACNNKNADERALQTGREAVAVADSFLDKEIDAKSAAAKVDDLSTNFEYVDFSGTGSENCDIDVKVIELSIALESVSEDGEDNEGVILEARNELAALIGINKRKESSYEDVETFTNVNF